MVNIVLVPNSYPSGQDLCLFTREFTPSFILSPEDLDTETIDNGSGNGSDSESQTAQSFRIISDNTVRKHMIVFI